jgi:hypothetical protein
VPDIRIARILENTCKRKNVVSVITKTDCQTENLVTWMKIKMVKTVFCIRSTRNVADVSKFRTVRRMYESENIARFKQKNKNRRDSRLPRNT